MLEVRGYSGTTLAVVSNAVYLLGTDDEILWIAEEGLPAHRRSILASFDPGRLRPGMYFSVEDHSLFIGEEVSLELESANVWEPPGIRQDQIVPVAALARSFRETLFQTEQLGSHQGFAQAISLVAALSRSQEPSVPRTALSSLDRALNTVESLARACLRREMGSAIDKAGKLVGLGPGLTPSGDDFVGGLLFVAHCLNVSYPDEFGWEKGAVGELLAQAYTETNRISHTILSDLALGHGPQPLHHLMVSLLQGGQAKSIMPHIIQLLRIGHTSGWDLLAGFMTGMLLTLGLATTQ